MSNRKSTTEVSPIPEQCIEFYRVLLRLLRKYGEIDGAKANAAAVRILRKHGVKPDEKAIQDLRNGALVLVERLIKAHGIPPTGATTS